MPPGTVSSLAFPNILTLNQTFGITNFGVPNALIQQQVAAGPYLYTPLCTGGEWEEHCSAVRGDE